MLDLRSREPCLPARRRPHAPGLLGFGQDFSAQPVGAEIDPFADGDIDAVFVDVGELRRRRRGSLGRREAFRHQVGDQHSPPLRLLGEHVRRGVRL